RHLVKHCQVTLERAEIERRFTDLKSTIEATSDLDEACYADEQLVALDELIKAAPVATGSLVWEGLYIPSVEANDVVQLDLIGVSAHSKVKAPRESLEFDEVPRACIACSI